MHSAGRMLMQRDQVLEEVSPGVTITRRAGEAMIYVDNQAAQIVRNTADASARAKSVRVCSTAFIFCRVVDANAHRCASAHADQGPYRVGHLE